MTFFVVFDTCTHARYHGAVHQVLALPEAAYVPCSHGSTYCCGSTRRCSAIEFVREVFLDMA